ncbi:MAG TPA: vitamin K epoxide reductase family protein [Terriglobia bacterium]|nr:vitamin K epoxide reductase family protein [Terriglobia bacterium]
MILGGPVIVLSLARLADALYFTFAYYGRVRKSCWVPAVFYVREGPSCVAVVRTTYGSVFGVPNSLLGIVYYVLLLVWALTWHSAISGSRVGLIILSTRFTDILIASGATTVALGFYLIFALRRILYTDCPWCYAAHGINLALLALLVVAR